MLTSQKILFVTTIIFPASRMVKIMIRYCCSNLDSPEFSALADGAISTLSQESRITTPYFSVKADSQIR